MKKRFYFLSLVVLLLSSCSSDSENSDSDLVLIKKIVTVFNDSSSTISFTYNGTKLNTIKFENYVLEHTYSGDQIMNVKRYSGQMLEGETFYEYDNLGRVASELFVYYLGDFSQKNTYTYNDNNTISFQMLSGDQFSQSPNGKSGLITQGSNGEALKVEVFNEGVFSSSEVFTYDAKNSPYKNITGYDKLPMNREIISNLIASVSLNADLNMETNSNYEYSYNGGNFPENRIQSFYENGVLKSNVNSSYFY